MPLTKVLGQYLLVAGQMRLLYRSIEIVREEGGISFLSSVRGSVFHRYRRYRRYILKTWYEFGSGRVCLICGWEGSKFLSYGVENRPDAVCPNCDAKERHRLIWDYFNKSINLRNSTDLLYFAPIEGLEQNLRDLDSTTVTTIDLTMEDVDISASITELPFDDSSFDIVICSHVLEHIPNDELALTELNRILRPGGQALILVPQDRSRNITYEDPAITTGEGRKEAFGQGDHVRWYGRDVRERLASAGFEVTLNNYIAQLDNKYVKKYKLKEDERWLHDHTLIFHCRKSNINPGF